jgi:DNA-directed RNA polymerase specialized sigma24 family protein
MSVALHDVHDVQAFVYERLDSQFPNLDWQEREELAAEGMVILYRMAQSFRPRLEGHAQDGRFSGYAARYLPRRLIRAWHRLHPEHVIVRQEGKERVEYRPAAEPLDDAMMASVMMAETTMDTVRYALRQQVSNEVEFTMQVATLRGMSLPRQEIASSLGCEVADVRLAEMRLARVRSELGEIDH